MAKQKTQWSCRECGNTQPKWTGQCDACSAWDSFVQEQSIDVVARFEGNKNSRAARPVRLREVVLGETPRFSCSLPECDRLFGGGVVPGSLTLVGGDPGVGKSTLLLQLAENFAKQGRTVLYICGEESVEQTSLRAKRLGVQSDLLYLLSETQFALIHRAIEEIAPQVLIVDSIQIVYKSEIPSAPGSVAQVREMATEFMHLAKGLKMATFLIGHVTKSGEIAGPRLLEHLVDTVIYFEGEQNHHYRMLRVVKNRFGPTDEVALFHMHPHGLVEVPNPSQLFLEQRNGERTGSVIIPVIEGTRAIVMEAQALVTETCFSTPSRRCTGFDTNRLALLLAVLEKRMGYPLHRCDVFVAMAGGMRVLEPSSDLGTLLAVASSFRNRAIDPHTAIVGEVGLGGEVRGVTRIESRIKELLHMGFRRCILPKNLIKGISGALKESITLEGVDSVDAAIDKCGF